MSADTRLNQFNGAVREALAECYRSTNWLASLANYSERLAADGWSRSEIAAVQTAVRRILGAVVHADRVAPTFLKSAPESSDVVTASP
jgi:hypothetical protein